MVALVAADLRTTAQFICTPPIDNAASAAIARAHTASTADLATDFAARMAA